MCKFFIGYSFIARMPWLCVYLQSPHTHSLTKSWAFVLIASSFFLLLLFFLLLSQFLSISFDCTHKCAYRWDWDAFIRLCLHVCACKRVSLVRIMSLKTEEENDKERRKRHQIMIRINGISSTVFLSLSPSH